MALQKIGVLGSGVVGQQLGSAFVELGHEVKLGAREEHNDKAERWAKQAGNRASSGAFADAAAFGDLLVLATLWTGTENALRLAGQPNFQGKVVIDVTNPLKYAPDAPPSLAIGHTDSGGESVQRWLPQARVVKAFNTVGAPHMFKPSFPGGPPDMFFCGNDGEAKKTVSALLQSFGWNPIDLGGIESARLLEPLCIVWVLYGLRTGTWNHAFKLLKK